MILDTRKRCRPSPTLMCICVVALLGEPNGSDRKTTHEDRAFCEICVARHME